MRAVYTTVEKVMRASDIKASAYLTTEIGEAIASSSLAVDKLVNLGDEYRAAFAPWTGAIVFDWPVANNGNAYRFWLNQFRLNSFSSIVSGGDALTSIALGWPSSGPPYSAIDVDHAGGDSFDFTSGIGQRSLSITGEWGTLGEWRSRSSWALGASVSASATTWEIDAPIGIGSLVQVGSERAIVTARGWSDSGQNASALTANVGAQSITVSDGSAFLAGEDILIDTERMTVQDVAGNTIAVRRAAGGSTLAAHTNGADIYWARSCTVERGALGSTADTHTDGAALSIYSPPALVEQLTIAYAIDRRAQESAGYARTIGQGESERQVSARGIGDLEKRMIAAYGRIRHRAI